MTVHAPYNFVPLADAVFTPPGDLSCVQDAPFEDGICGTIAFTITSETPLLVGGRRKGPRNNHAGLVEFFKLPAVGENDGTRVSGQYAIPGSSLRGLVRNVLEIVSFSRMGFVDEQHFAIRDLTPGANYQKLFARTKPQKASDGRSIYQNLSNAGWLVLDRQSGDWSITPCNFARVEMSELFDTKGTDQSFPGGPAVFFDSQKANARAKYRMLMETLSKPLLRTMHVAPSDTLHSTQEGKALLEFVRAHTAPQTGTAQTTPVSGLVVVTGQPNPKKHREFFFYDKAGQPVIPVSPAKMALFRQIALADTGSGDEATEATNTWKFWEAAHLANKDWARRIPVFYIANPDGTLLALGLSMMFPKPAEHTIHDLIYGKGRDGIHQRDRSDGKAIVVAAPDLAEAIFGRVAGSKDSLKGRASFSLALADATGPAPRPQRQNAAILNSPKASFYPAYLRQPDAEGSNNGQLPNHLNDRGKLVLDRSYKTYDTPGTEISGWKRYPVHGQAMVAPLSRQMQEKTQLQVVMEPLAAGVRFRGELRIHNLRPFELGALLWALTLGGVLDPGAVARHAFGMGKPMGFGRVRITLGDARLLPNDGSAPQAPSHYAKAFVDLMDVWCKERFQVEWAQTDQVQSLLAMADPTFNAADTVGPLRHLVLSERNDEFRAAKVRGHALRPFVARKQKTRSLVGAPAAYGSGKPASASAQQQPASDWLFAPGSRVVWLEIEEVVTLLQGVKHSQTGTVPVRLEDGTTDDAPVAKLKRR